MPESEIRLTIDIQVYDKTRLPTGLRERFSIEFVGEDGSVSVAKTMLSSNTFQIVDCSGNGDCPNIYHRKVKVQIGVTIDEAKHIGDPWRRLRFHGSESDVALTCSDDHVVMCHQIILRTRSAVFSTLLNEENENESRTKRIDLKSYSSRAVRDFVSYLYTGVMRITESERFLMELIEMGDKYKVDGLKRECIHRLYVKTDLKMLPAVLILSFLQKDAQMLYEITKRRICSMMDSCQRLEDWAKVQNYPTIVNDLQKTAVTFKKSDMKLK